MGTTGLETAFAALYTELVLPGVLPLGLVVDRLSGGAALVGLPLTRIAVGRAGEPLPGRPRRRVGGRRGRLREPLGELLLRGPHAAAGGSWRRSPRRAVAYRERMFALGVA